MRSVIQTHTSKSSIVYCTIRSLLHLYECVFFLVVVFLDLIFTMWLKSQHSVFVFQALFMEWKDGCLMWREFQDYFRGNILIPLKKVTYLTFKMQITDIKMTTMKKLTLSFYKRLGVVQEDRPRFLLSRFLFPTLVDPGSFRHTGTHRDWVKLIF